MKISFVLPGFSRVPVGGYKMVFEYANRLVRHGFQVQIIFINNNSMNKIKAPFLIKKCLMSLATHYEPDWFSLDKRIKKISYYSFDFSQEIKTDVAIATAVETVLPTQKIFVKARKFYFIQDYEDWNVSREYLHSTYKLGFKNIVIAKWLKKVVDRYSNIPSIYIQNPIDLHRYLVKKSIEDRNKYTIGMLYHSAMYKGSKPTLESLMHLKRKYPKLKIVMFGTCEPPKNLPNWVKFYKNASQQKTIEIYNEISIFVSGSIKEGFGLTGLEAMACGAALVTTNFDGAKEYAKNEVNSLVVPVKDWDGISEKVQMLIDDDEYRVRLAQNGVKSANRFSWDKAYNKFSSALKEN